MSFLSLLLFASAFYFVYGRPDDAIASAISSFDAMAEAVDDKAIDPTSNMSSSEPDMPENVKLYYDQVSAFVEEVHKAVDTYLKPIISGVGDETGNMIMSIVFHRLHGELEYIMNLMNNDAENPTGGFDPFEPQYPFYDE